MERFTNSVDKFRAQLQIELYDFSLDENWKTEFVFFEMLTPMRYAYSINLSSNEKESRFQLTQKIWNAEYDGSRFQYGIYNIDRLAISERIIEIGEDEFQFLNKVNYDKMSVVLRERIVLDGLMCKFEIPQYDKFFRWNLDDEMNEALSALINWIRNKI